MIRHLASPTSIVLMASQQLVHLQLSTREAEVQPQPAATTGVRDPPPSAPHGAGGPAGRLWHPQRRDCSGGLGPTATLRGWGPPALKRCRGPGVGREPGTAPVPCRRLCVREGRGAPGPSVPTGATSAPERGQRPCCPLERGSRGRSRPPPRGRCHAAAASPNGPCARRRPGGAPPSLP